MVAALSFASFISISASRSRSPGLISPISVIGLDLGQPITISVTIRSLQSQSRSRSPPTSRHSHSNLLRFRRLRETLLQSQTHLHATLCIAPYIIIKSRPAFVNNILRNVPFDWTISLVKKTILLKSEKCLEFATLY